MTEESNEEINKFLDQLGGDLLEEFEDHINHRLNSLNSMELKYYIWSLFFFGSDFMAMLSDLDKQVVIQVDPTTKAGVVKLAGEDLQKFYNIVKMHGRYDQ